ncbi:NAD-binding protein [Schizopora paradoxa]|uniref:NAD-binding protein n=1 Tax=Schizopora paradoxa TaxID=27342 RepID=A0A0H2RS72_9AGAM|nr:NAD-binding protein [Schizopora paradoxa]
MTFGVSPETHNDIYPAIEASKFSGALKDKVAFVTGAGRGIGKAIAISLAQAGANVAIISRTKSDLDELAEIIRTKYNQSVLVFPIDVTNESAITDAFATTERELGKVNIVIANAAMAYWRPFVYDDFDDWWRSMETNVKAPMFLIQLALRSMRERNEGTIIALGSAAALRNSIGTSSYASSKIALHRAIATLQLELDTEGKSGICLYALQPGRVKTTMTTGDKSLHEDMEKLSPGFSTRIREWVDAFIDPPELAGQTCVYLATGKAKELRGRYIEAEKDIDAVVEQAEIVRKENLYDTTIRMLGE